LKSFFLSFFFFFLLLAECTSLRQKGLVRMKYPQYLLTQEPLLEPRHESPFAYINKPRVTWRALTVSRARR
jgi:hypothetical protein